MLELLHRWAALQPGRCCFVRVMSVHIWLNDGPQNIHASSGVGRAVIQAAVQEAVTVHGWWYELNRYERNGREVYACVGIKPSEPGKANPIFRNHWGSEEAETFLTAYLAALQAQ